MSKLNKEQKLRIYNEWKIQNKPVSVIASELNLNPEGIRYMLKLIDRYGIEIYDKSIEIFTKEFKEKVIKQAFL